MKLDSVIKDYAKAHQKTYSSIYRAIKRYDRIVVFRHIKPDFDAMGTQMGLTTFLKDNFPEKEIHFVGDNHVTFTPRLFPETERLNDAWFDKPFLAIVVDVGDDERIADPRYKRASYICKIDHHPCKAEIAKHPLLDLDMAAASELVADLLLSWKGMRMSQEAAHYLYIGIVGDSGRFQYSQTTAHTFAIAEALIQTGISINAIYLAMYEKKIDDLKVTAYILNHFSVSPHGIAYYLLPDDIQKELGHHLGTGQGERQSLRQHPRHQCLVFHHRRQGSQGTLLADLHPKQERGHLPDRLQMGRRRTSPGFGREDQGSQRTRRLHWRPRRDVCEISSRMAAAILFSKGRARNELPF
jgi:phosphoesterase RecJ-like protein